MRRVVDDDPPSGAARWTCRLGGAALAVVIAAVALSRTGTVAPGPAIDTLRAAVALAALAVVTAVVAAVEIWRTGRVGVGAMLSGIVLAAAASAGPLWFAVATAGRPAIADVSTSATDPPSFLATPAAIARRNGAIHPLPSADARRLQASGYPDLQTLDVELDPADAYAACIKIAKARRWRVLVANPPQGNGAGQMEVTARTLIMGFPEDIAFRILPNGPGQSRVDVRVAGRWSFGDGGNGAALIRSLAADLDAAADE